MTSARFDSSLQRDLDGLRQHGMLRQLRTIEHRDGVSIRIAGRSLIDFSSNDYLGLATDPRIAAAARAALAASHFGATASRSLGGNHVLHEELEAALARLKGAEAALLFATGFAANAGIIPAIAERGDVIYSDELNHASIVDGCRLARATTRIMPHCDLNALERQLAADRGNFRRSLIVVEGVFSMDGDLYPLAELVPLAERFAAAIYLDDAHATGVLGASGNGSAEHWGVTGSIDITVGTLGKALGTSGAFAAGSQTLRAHLLNRVRSFIFSTGTPPALCAATLAALAISAEEPERRTRLQQAASYLHNGLARRGLAPAVDGPGHIVPVVLGDPARTVAVGNALLERGYLVGAIRPPSVPTGGSRLRITVSAAHTDRDIDGLLAALDSALRSFG